MKTSHKITAILSLVFALLASGCAMLKPDSEQGGPDTDTQIEKMIALQEYGKALELLNRLEIHEDGAYSVRKKELLERIGKLEKRTIAEASEKTSHQELQAAITIVDNALQKVPASQALTDLRQKIAEQRAIAMTEASTYLDLLEAEYLLNRLRIFEKQARLTKPSIISRWQMDRMKGSLNSLRGEFLKCEKLQTDRGNTALAEQCFEMAETIRPDAAGKEPAPSEPKEITGPAELSAKKKKRPGSMLSPSAVQPPASNSGPEQIPLTAQPSLTQPDIGKKTSDDKLISQYLQEGNNLYRAGKIKEARDIWQKALALDGKNLAAQEKISRAEKILHRLEDLKKTKSAPVDKK